MKIPLSAIITVARIDRVAGAALPAHVLAAMEKHPAKEFRRTGPRPLGAYLQSVVTLAGPPGAHGAAIDPARLVQGLRAYWRHPYRRPAQLRPIVWSEGSSRLFDLGRAGDPPVLVVPSLVNRSDILDLLPGRSLLAHLRTAGLRPFLLDWGEPRGAELALDLEGYVHGRAAAALDAIGHATHERPALLGYCMGGLLAAALAAKHGEALTGVAFLATPWNFHAEPARMDGFLVAASGVVAALGHAPVELLQTFFMLQDPGSVVRKLKRLEALTGDGPRDEFFVAVEDWLNHGAPMAGPVAQECLWHWYIENRPGRGVWTVGGVPVRPERLEMPAFVALPRHDRVVPTASAEALAAALPAPTVIRPEAGHIGMVVGDGAPSQLWAPLTAWLRRIAPRRKVLAV